MAAAFRRILFPTRNILNSGGIRTVFTKASTGKHVPIIGKVCGCIGGTVVACYLVKTNLTSHIDTLVVASKGDDQRSSEKRAVLQTQRELRFLSFASVEHEGNVYMTPEDFLESVTEEAPRPRSGRRRLSPDDVERCFRSTPGKNKGSTLLFRNLHDKGLISYTEYLFLLCVLTKPKSGFKIAFNMFDTDGNQRVDKKEFLVCIDVISSAKQSSTALERIVPKQKHFPELCTLLDVYENRFGRSKMRQTERVGHTGGRQTLNIWNKINQSTYEGIIAGFPKEKETESSQPVASLDTTLTVHFFGRRGRDTLRYEDFHRFMDNLQTEVLELEFGEFSRGMKTITEVEFAQILLRYTILTAHEHDEYLQRLRNRISNVKGVTFQEFKDFCQFLNNLDDFTLAMRMYTYANHPISQEDFKRAVQACTGQSLSDHVVDVVYKLFDKDGDNHLSHKEFVSVMKDRLHRGFRNYTLHQNNWEMFKSCVKNEMKAV